MPKRTPRDWAELERLLYNAGASPADVAAGAQRLLAEARSRTRHTDDASPLFTDEPTRAGSPDCEIAATRPR